VEILEIIWWKYWRSIDGRKSKNHQMWFSESFEDLYKNNLIKGEPIW